jgi:CPA2 family monovalent cation:H+ antiporter-2
MLGLEYSARELTDGIRTGWRDGALDMTLNFVPGFGAGLILGWGVVAALLLGGITYISSSGIVAKLITDLGWIGNRETPGVLSVLVQEDLVMAAFLPIVAILLAGTAPLSAAVSVVLAVGAVALVIAVALRWGDRMSQLVFSRSDEATLLSIFGITLVVAGAAEQLAVSAAVGAFLVGLTLSGDAADRARVLLGPLRDLFGAVFFVFFGLRIDPGTIPPVVWQALALGAVGIATKYATGWLTARRGGIGPRGRFRAASLLIARGEFSIAIAALGVSAGVEPALGPMTAAYVLLLAVVGPILSRFADIRSRRPSTAHVRVSE